MPLAARGSGRVRMAVRVGAATRAPCQGSLGCDVAWAHLSLLVVRFMRIVLRRAEHAQGPWSLGVWHRSVDARVMSPTDPRSQMRPRVPPGSEAPTVELIAFRHGREIARELYDTPEEATEAVERWTEEAGVVCQVDDLAVHHAPSDIRDPTPDDGFDDEE